MQCFDLLSTFVTKMLTPKGQPDPSLQPQPRSSKFIERLEEQPRGQNCTAGHPGLSGVAVRRMLSGKDPICCFISPDCSKGEVPNTKLEFTLSVLSRNSCTLGWASYCQEQPQSVSKTRHCSTASPSVFPVTETSDHRPLMIGVRHPRPCTCTQSSL